MSKKSKDQSTVRKAQTRGRHARGIGLRPFVCTRRHLRSFAQGLALITLLLDRSQHFALYVQGGVPRASGLGLANQVALYVQGLVLTTPLLDWSQHFALYVQGGIADAPGLSRVSQVALYVQGLVLTTPLLDWSRHSTLYAQGGIQDHSVAGRTPSFFQSLLNPTQLSKCSCCPIDQLTPGGPMDLSVNNIDR